MIRRRSFSVEFIIQRLFTLASLGAVACTSMPTQVIQQGVAYKYDMLLTVDGIEREGMLVAPKRTSHSIAIEAQGDLDLFTLESCHRSMDTENAGRGWWIFGSKRKLNLTYTPAPTIETVGMCPVRLGGYTEKNGQSSWGYLDFEDSETTLTAKVQCNGAAIYESNGVTVCQGKFGSLQKIWFPEKVVAKFSQGCEIPIPDGQKEFLFPLAKGFCVYSFTEVAPLERQRRHRLSTYGYEQIILHGRD